MNDRELDLGYNDSLQQKTDMFGEDLYFCHFAHHKSHIHCPGIENGLLQLEAGYHPPKL
jgi:hypothetical protein